MTLALSVAKRDEFLLLWRAGGDVDRSAALAGVGTAIARRWIRECGGVIRMRRPSSGYRLSLEEREEIEERLACGQRPAAIARALGRPSSTISRELARNRGTAGRTSSGRQRYRPYSARVAQVRAEHRARRPKATKLSVRPRLRVTVAAWIGGPCRMSPQQVAHRLGTDFPDDGAMRISAETIYQELYVQGRGSLRVDLHQQLRTGRARRVPRRAAKRPRVPGELLIANRPKDVDDRTVPGHWEGDLIIGRNGASAIGTLVERYTRFVILLHLPDRHDATAVADQIAAAIADLPAHLARSLTWDQGIELVASHQRIRLETGLTVWFCDPASPWQRGSNENTNGLLRQYFPKGTDLSVHTPSDLEEVADGMNNRPRKTLGWRTPAEALNEVLSGHQPQGVALTP